MGITVIDLVHGGISWGASLGVDAAVTRWSEVQRVG